MIGLSRNIFWRIKGDNNIEYKILHLCSEEIVCSSKKSVENFNIQIFHSQIGMVTVDASIQLNLKNNFQSLFLK